ncbi:MAG: sodium:solute symporter, partial [Bacteroidota bacterium]
PNPQWMVLSDWSSKGSIGPQGTWQSNGIDNCLYFISGQSSTVPYSSGPTPSLTSMIHSFNPNQKSWDSPVAVKTEELASILIEPVGIYAMGTADIFAIGRQKRADETPSTERHLLVYHTILKNWNLLGELSAAPILHFFKLSNNRLAFLRWQMEEGEKPRLELLEVRVINQQQGLSWLNTIVLLLYFALLIALGFYFSRRQKDANDYFKGGQKIPWWAAGLSLYGTGLSAISYMAVPAKTYATDWAYFMTKLPQLLIPIIVGALFIPFYKKLNITTAYEYLERRFNLATRLVGSLSFIIFQLGRIGIVLFLPAVALNVATGIDIILCILLMGGISLIYTIMGGIEAVIWSDVLQVIILIGGILLCLVLISLGLDGGMQEVVAVGIEYKKFEIINMAFDFTQPTFWVVVLAGFFSQLITYSTDQTMVQRYLTTKDTQAARRSIWTSTLVSLSIGWIFFFMGTALFAYYQARPAELLPAMSANDAIFPWYIFSALPDGISGLLIAGIFAAAMSSLSSSMNSAATAYTIDFHQTFGWKGDELWVGKVATLVFGVAGITFALLFATMDIKSIWDEFLKIIGLIAGGLGGVFLLGIISTRANGAGALIGLFGSGVVQFMMAAYQPVHFLLFTATGFISCLVIGYLASFLFPTHGKAIDGLTVYG